MKNSSPFSLTHHHLFSFHDDDDNDDIICCITPPSPSADQIFHQSSGDAFHAPGSSSTSNLHANHRQLPHFIGGGGGDEDNNYNNLPDQPPSSTAFQPDQIFHQSSGGSTSILHANHRQLPHLIGGGGGDEDNNYNNLPDQPPSSTAFQPDQIFHQSSGGAFHAPGSSTSILHENHQQLPHFTGGGGDDDNNYNNLPNQPPSSTAFHPGKHVEPVVITANPIYDYSYLFDQPVDQDWFSSSNIDYNFSFENYIDFDATPQTQNINHSEALLHEGGGVASQPYREATIITGTQRRQYKRWTHEEMSNLLAAIYEFRKSRYLWEDVKKNHFCDDIGRSTNTLKQKFKEMCKAAAMSSSVRDPKTRELYNRALMLRGEIKQKKGFKKSFTGN